MCIYYKNIQKKKHNTNTIEKMGNRLFGGGGGGEGGNSTAPSSPTNPTAEKNTLNIEPESIPVLPISPRVSRVPSQTVLSIPEENAQKIVKEAKKSMKEYEEKYKKIEEKAEKPPKTTLSSSSPRGSARSKRPPAKKTSSRSRN